MAEVINIALAGVGGQGIVMAGNIISSAALCAGYDVKKNELHGMAQRGGSVVSEVRFGKKIFSPVIPDGEVDILLALEMLEGLRYAHLLRDGGMIIADELRIPPAVKPAGAPDYPADIVQQLKRAAKKVLLIPAAKLAAEAGNARAANTVLLGALSRQLDLPPAAWHAALQTSLKPALVEVNLKAFDLGRKFRRK